MSDDAGARAQGRRAEGELHGAGRRVLRSLRCAFLPAPARPCLPAGKLSGRPHSCGFREGFTTEATGITHPTCGPAPPSGGQGQTGSATVPSTPCSAGAGAHRGGPLHNSRRACRSRKDEGLRSSVSGTRVRRQTSLTARTTQGCYYRLGLLDGSGSSVPAMGSPDQHIRFLLSHKAVRVPTKGQSGNWIPAGDFGDSKASAASGRIPGQGWWSAAASALAQHRTAEAAPDRHPFTVTCLHV